MLKKSASAIARDDCGNHISCCAGALIFFAFLVKLFCLITNILFGILTGVIKLYYICSYIKDRKARNGNTLHWPMSWWSLRGVFYTNKNVTICSQHKQLCKIKKSRIIYVVAAVALQAQFMRECKELLPGCAFR